LEQRNKNEQSGSISKSKQAVCLLCDRTDGIAHFQYHSTCRLVLLDR